MIEIDIATLVQKKYDDIVEERINQENEEEKKKKKQEQGRKIQPIHPKKHPKPMHRKHPTVRSFLRLRHLFFVCRKKLTAKKMSKL